MRMRLTTGEVDKVDLAAGTMMGARRSRPPRSRAPRSGAAPYSFRPAVYSCSCICMVAMDSLVLTITMMRRSSSLR